MNETELLLWASEERTLGRLLQHQAAVRGEEPFLRFQEEPWWTFSKVDSATNRAAQALLHFGVGPGDRVAFMLPNGIDLVLMWFAVAKMGGIEVPLNPELRGELLAHQLRNCAPAAIVCHEALADVLEEVLEHDIGCRLLIVLGEPGTLAGRGDARRVVTLDEVLAHPLNDPPSQVVRASDPVAILYTSGTTGPAKGVVMSHGHFCAYAEGYVRNMGLTSQDSYYTPLPLFHLDAQVLGVVWPVMFGARATLDERFSASAYWDRVRSSGASATNLLGAMTHILWKADRKANDHQNPLRVAQALPMVSFKREFEDRFGLRLVTGYGQTETNLVAHDTLDASRSGSCGRAAPGFEIAVVDDDDRRVPPGVVGEIVVRSAEPWTMCSGYYRLPEATVAAYRNLWWHSGDAGHLDADGWLYFDGRIKDTIRRRGENISAQELEGVVDNHPAVLESAAIAVPSELSEDEIKVVAVIRPGSSLTESELAEFCRAQVPRHMVPRFVELRHDPLPRTPTEKIAKEGLRKEGVTAATWDGQTARLERTLD